MTFATVIVTYNRLQLLKECIHAVQAQTYKINKIIVVDNASTDGTYEWLEENRTQDMIIIHQEKNGGGAAGYYYGLEYAANHKMDWILLIDDDAILERDFLEKIYGEMINRTGSDSNVLAYSGTVKSAGEISCFHRGYNRGRLLYRRFNVPEEKYLDRTFEYDYASFCGLMVSGKVIEVIGLPEKNYFIWFDDTEYSLRLRKISRIVNVSSAVLDHRTEENQRNKRGWKEYYGIRNKIDMVKKHYGKLALFIVVVKEYFCIIRDAGKDLRQGYPGVLKRGRIRVMAVRDGMKGKLGMTVSSGGDG